MTGPAGAVRADALLRAVGQAYRDAGGRGANELGRLEAAEDAFLAAGGVAEDRRDLRAAVSDMIMHLARDRADWLLGPAIAWMERHCDPDQRDPADVVESMERGEC